MWSVFYNKGICELAMLKKASLFHPLQPAIYQANNLMSNLYQSVVDSATTNVEWPFLLHKMYLNRCNVGGASETASDFRDIDTAAEIAGWLTDDLGPAAFLTGTKPAASSRIVDLYHGKTHASDQQRILKNFVQDTHLRVLVATVAFGMGIEIRDVRSVIMWGPPKDLSTFWQEVGRAGRDGAPAEAIVYLYPHAVNPRFIAEDMCELCQSYGDECIHKHVLRRFSLCKETDIELDAIGGGARCCSTCDEKWFRVVTKQPFGCSMSYTIYYKIYMPLCTSNFHFCAPWFALFSRDKETHSNA